MEKNRREEKKLPIESKENDDEKKTLRFSLYHIRKGQI